MNKTCSLSNVMAVAIALTMVQSTAAQNTSNEQKPFAFEVDQTEPSCG